MDRLTLAAWALTGFAAFSIYRNHMRGERERERGLFGSLIARVGFLLLGLTYALNIERSWANAPMYALVLVLIGTMLEAAVRLVRWLARRGNPIG